MAPHDDDELDRYLDDDSDLEDSDLEDSDWEYDPELDDDE